MPSTEAMNKARKKYDENVKQVGTKIDKQIYEIMLQYCKQTDTTKKQFIENAIQFYIDTHWRIS